VWRFEKTDQGTGHTTYYIKDDTRKQAGYFDTLQIDTEIGEGKFDCVSTSDRLL
jgi:hypothetical protein